MNLSGSVEGNWRWRCTDDEIMSGPVLDRLRALLTSPEFLFLDPALSRVN